jgi:hypothetical protein
LRSFVQRNTLGALPNTLGSLTELKFLCVRWVIIMRHAGCCAPLTGAFAVPPQECLLGGADRHDPGHAQQPGQARVTVRAPLHARTHCIALTSAATHLRRNLLFAQRPVEQYVERHHSGVAEQSVVAC